MASGTERAEPGDSEQDEEDVYEVERIIDMQVREVRECICDGASDAILLAE